MIGNIRWNLWMGLFGLVVTFVLSVSTNPWLTALKSSLYSFMILFVFTFIVRWVMGTPAGFKVSEEEEEEDTIEEEGLGNQVDLVTPDDPHHPVYAPPESKAGNDVDFQPMKPPKLITKDLVPPEEMAQALRRLSEE